jgi:uncharacterized protein YbbK (DUF523 family)
LTATFGPEVELGMEVPREPIGLVGSRISPRLLGKRSGKDWTDAMHRFATKRADQLESLNLSGYIFKKNSPSCGFERVRVYNSKGVPSREGRGLFAAAVIKRFSLMPAEEEGRLQDLSCVKTSSSGFLTITDGKH